jgi:hypothetical protein
LFAEDEDLALVSKVTLYEILVYKACHDALHLTARLENWLKYITDKLYARYKSMLCQNHLIHIHVDLKPFQSFYYDV